ncbi:MAG: MCE family protein [Deltaproteobacteria bacterium]|jgi:paraquat-inducible protein B|nr:MCE family protein [Deltaproteobacteria bacterium]
MSSESSLTPNTKNAPEAQIQTKRSFSVIWVIPIIALLIGGGLVFKALSEKGPTITIKFETAEGLEADKTKIKFKDVEVGKVVSIDLLDDLSGVVVKAEMSKEAEPFMTENTRFWVVRARVAAGEVSGLGTLFSGAYIGCSPSSEGKKQKHFTGLETPPVLTNDLPGRHFVLEAKTLGSLDIGAPVYYRGIKVGQVVQYDFDEQAEAVLIKVFINDPFQQKVRQNTRFWNASGIDMTMDATGVKMDTQSLVTIMLGGVAFDLRPHDQPKPQAEDEREFLLYENHETSQEDQYTIKRYYLMYFDQSVRGLNPGAPVEIMGIQVGEVVSVELHYDIRAVEFRIPVLVVLEPERIHAVITEEGELVKGEAKEEAIEENEDEVDEITARGNKLVKKGLRGQLKLGNLLTGQLYIDLTFYPDAPPASLIKEDGYLVFPTVAAPLEQIVHRVDNILKKIELVPFGKISEELQAAITELTATLKQIKGVSGKVNQETIPKVNASLERLEETLAGLESTLGPDSALNYNARQISSELAMAIRSIRSLLSYLERDPQALILGKEGDKQ